MIAREILVGSRSRFPPTPHHAKLRGQSAPNTDQTRQPPQKRSQKTRSQDSLMRQNRGGTGTTGTRRTALCKVPSSISFYRPQHAANGLDEIRRGQQCCGAATRPLVGVCVVLSCVLRCRFSALLPNLTLHGVGCICSASSPSIWTCICDALRSLDPPACDHTMRLRQERSR